MSHARKLIGAVLVALAVLAPAAGAAEVGECAVQKPGAYSNNTCTLTSGALNHEWRQLAPPNNGYTDGHPEVIGDERQSFDGEGVRLFCKGNVVVGEVASFTTNVQFMHEYKCELLAPFRAKCGNAAEDQIDTMPEEGVYEDGTEGTVVNRLALNANFQCGTLPATLTGGYVGTLGYPLGGAMAGQPIVNKQIHKYDLLTGSGSGEQAVTLTVGLQSWPVTMTGDQEDRMATGYLVVRP